MNICNNIIKDEEIIGIGPLLWHQKGQVPAVCFYAFNVFTRQTCIEIKSQTVEAFNAIDPDDQKNLKEFQSEYWAIRKKIAALIGEADPDHQPYAQKMQQAFHCIEVDIEELSNRIQAMKTPKKSELLQTVCAVHDNVHLLKTIATA